MKTLSVALQQVKLQYADEIIVENLSIDFDKPEIVSIIGANGSGKSTILKALGRILQPSKGNVIFDGKLLQDLSTKEVAKQLAILPQAAQAPGDMTVRDLVACGRLPYQGLFTEISTTDAAAIAEAIQLTNLEDLAHRRLDMLSGGERQRAWLAMTIAQKPKVLLLDEPTTYLDVQHQFELMQLVQHLHSQMKITVIMVLHDLNHAARFSHRLIGLKKGQIIADGSVEEVFKTEVLEELYNVKMLVMKLKQAETEYLACFPYKNI